MGPEPEFAALVGIDWADRKHVWCLQAAGSTTSETGELEHKVEAVEAWVAELCRRFGHRPIAVAVEQVKGALVFLLNKYECLHIFPVPSTMTAKMREALYPSGAKDDPRDADLLLYILARHRDKLHRLSPDDEATRRVQNLVEERRKLTAERVAQGNRLISYLKVYFRQMVEWFEKLDIPLVCDFLERWPTLEELQKVSGEDLRRFFREHHCHRGLMERRILAIGGAIPAGGDRAVIEAKSTVVKVIVQLMRSLLEGIAELDRKIEEVAVEHPDFFIFASLPGAGAVMAPRLLAAFGSQRDRYNCADELQTYSGIAPVTESSGKRKWVHFRWACPKFLRQSFHEWAGHSIAQSTWARAYYQQQRRRGSDHHAAVRALAFKWIRIVFRCWQDRVAYDESRYLAALARRGSPLGKLVDAGMGSL
ncbi:MAG: IS110 family transposase [Acidobacteria bacterium]|nr:IS110 family transposase [Acidobacteriota bacterium]